VLLGLDELYLAGLFRNRRPLGTHRGRIGIKLRNARSIFIPEFTVVRRFFLLTDSKPSPKIASTLAESFEDLK
jgi:hypothetical protein